MFNLNQSRDQDLSVIHFSRLKMAMVMHGTKKAIKKSVKVSISVF